MADRFEHPGLEAIEADLEDGRPFPVLGRQFAAVVCTNYLHRPLLPHLVAAVGPGGVFLYETFTEGHELLGGRPRRPEFLLRPGELEAAVAGELTVRAYETRAERPGPALVQHIAAVRELD